MNKLDKCDFCKSDTKILGNTKTVINLAYYDNFDIEELEARRLHINDEIDESMLSTISYHIMRYNRLDKDISIEERIPIILYINSTGGNVSDGYGIIDTILASKTPVYTVNMALCASMSFLIFLAGSKRFSMPHSEFLMHDGSAFAMDSTAKVRDRIEFETQIEKKTKEYVLQRTNITNDLYNKKYRVEWWMLPEEATKYNIVTHIIGTNCELEDIL